MGFFKYIANRIPASQSGTIDADSYEPLDRASFIELFFDLVFIFCIRSILPIITDVEGGQVDWYSYYTFCFTFTLMLQIWFNSTIFMNRFGSGRAPDVVFLTTNMFLLFIMTQAISTSWEYYTIYNISWVLIVVNTMIHWVIRYRSIINPPYRIRRDTVAAIFTLVVQAALVLISQPMPKVPAQIICLVAMLVGFAFWRTGGKDDLGERNKAHLAERCALLMVLTFGETLIGFGREVSTDLNLFEPIMYFLLILGMFLIYLNEILNLLDLDTIVNGRKYMALSAWMTFCVANVTAGFDMTARGMDLMGMEGDVYFGISVLVFLLSFQLYLPYGKYKHPSVKWIVARIVACLFVLLQTSSVAVITYRLLNQTAMSQETVSELFTLMSFVMMVLAVAAVYAVLIIDRIAVRRQRKAASAGEPSGASAAEQGVKDCLRPPYAMKNCFP